MFKINTDQLKEFEHKLRAFPKAMKFAQRDTNNNLAWETRKVAQRDLPSRMILRNAWTSKSIQVDGAKSTRDPSIVGSTLEYMADQEFGGTRVRKGKTGVPIPTSTAAGQGKQSPRTKLVRPRNRLVKLQLSKVRQRAASLRQQTKVTIAEAVKTGRREVYINTGRKQFIAKVKGGKRNPSIEMLYDLTRRSTPIPRNPWLSDATDLAVTRRDKFYRKNLARQLKRLR